jgi:hypothetical protein
MSKSTPILVILNILLSLITYSQRSVVPGFIVHLSGDTTHGYLKKQSGRSASSRCLFYTDKKGDATEYLPNQLKGYRYENGKLYVSKMLVNERDTALIFMEYLIKGVNSIYFSSDSRGEHYYIEKAGTRLVELSEELSIYKDNTAKPIKFRGKLRAIMADCDSIAPAIEKAELSHISLINLSKKYHDYVCPNDECVIYERKNNKVIIEHNLILGASANKYNFATSIISDYGSCFQIGYGIDFFNFLVSSEHFGIGVKFLLEKDHAYDLKAYKSDGYFHPVIYDGTNYKMYYEPIFGSTQQLHVNLDVVSLKIPLTINYLISTEKMRWYVGLGITDKFILSQNSKFTHLEFSNQYGQSINSVLAGVIFNWGVSYHISAKHKQFLNFTYEYLLDPRALNTNLRLYNYQFGIQTGISL